MNNSGLGIILTNIANAVPAFRGLLEVFAIFLGLFYLIQAGGDAIILSKGRQGQMMGNHPMPTELLSKIIIGCLLLSFGFTVETLVNTISSNFTTYAILNTQTVTEYGRFNHILTALLKIVQAIGLIGILRGLMIFKAASSSQGGQQGLGKATLLVLGGSLAVNLLGVIKMIEVTGNINLSSLIS